jgi:hypothetical protein
MSEAEIDGCIDDQFWLSKDCKYMLSVEVHRKCSEWTTDCADAGPGQPRTAQRAREAARTAKVRAEDKQEKERAIESRVEYQAKSLQLQEAYTNQAIQKSKVKIMTAERKHIESQLRNLKANKDSFVMFEGEEAYHKKVHELVKALFSVSVPQDLPASHDNNMNNGDKDDEDSDDGSGEDMFGNTTVAPV